MPQVKLISPITRQEIRKIRVAAYCRVSSNSADQQNSLRQPDPGLYQPHSEEKEWELVEIFADEGGLWHERTEPHRIPANDQDMCEQHKSTLIVTKSVSRFARNAKGVSGICPKLQIARRGVQFEKEESTPLALEMRCCSIPSLPSHRRSLRQFPRTSGFPSKPDAVWGICGQQRSLRLPAGG